MAKDATVGTQTYNSADIQDQFSYGFYNYLGLF